MEEKTIRSSELLDVVRSMKKEDELFYFFLRCCENGNLQLCQLCLDAGADINIAEHYYGQTLFKAFSSSEKFTTKVADWLIDKGADINDGGCCSSPLGKACEEGNFEMAKYFIDKGAKIHQYKITKEPFSDLYNAVNRGNLEIVRLLLNEGIDLEADNYQANPFYSAVRWKYYDIVELFLQKGISPNLVISYCTPLHQAVANKDTKTARLLLEYNANVNAKIQDYNLIKEYLSITPMDIAVFNKDTAMQKLLLEFGGTISDKYERVNALLKCAGKEEISSLIEKVLAS